MVATLLEGFIHAMMIFGLQIGLVHALSDVPTGTRAQAAGACITTLIMLISGFVLGLRNRERPEEESARTLRGVPVRVIWAAALFLGIAGVLGQFTELLAAVVPRSTSGEGGMARVVFGANTTVLTAVFMMWIGALLGNRARRWTLLWSLIGFAFLAGVTVGLGKWAPYASYDATTIAALSVGGAMLAALLTGFFMAWIRLRLAIVELALVSLYAGYTIFLIASIGPASLISHSNLPEEQIFLGLSVLPSIICFALMAVGSSIGFLLHGGGRFDPGLRFESLVGLRYLKTHSRDGFIGLVTVIAVVGVMLGVMALVVVLSVMSGFEQDLKRKILGAHSHVIVSKHGDDFTEYADVEAQIAKLPDIASVAAFVLGDAMISTDAGLSGTLIKGIDPKSSDATLDLRANLTKGSIEALSSPEIIPGARKRIPLSVPGPDKVPRTRTGSETTSAVDPWDFAVPAIREPAESGGRVLPAIIIGEELSKTLRAYVGDVVKVVSPVSEEIGPMGPTPKLRRFRVGGIFYSGMYEYDAKFTYVDMAQAQRFFGKRGRVTGVELKVKDIDDTARFVEELKRRLGGFPYTVKDWREMNKELFSALLLEKLAMFIGLTKIILVASFLIVLTLVMIVLQRGKEIAILKSIGASDASIMKMFVVQGVIVGVGGALLGVIVGVVICFFLTFIPLDTRIFYIERLPVVIDWGEVLAIAIAAMLLTYLATIYPAMTAAQLRPVEGLRDD